MLLRRLFQRSLLISLLVVASASFACAGPKTARVYVRTAPPVRIVEVRPAAPGPGFAWIEGFHRWDGARYAWVPGRWERVPRPRAVWVPGHWVKSRRGWYFAEGHWRH